MATVQRKLEGAVLAADGSTDSVNWTVGVGSFAAYGAFGGGTVTLEVSFDGGTTWFAVGASTTLTADGVANFDLPAGVLVRGTLSGSAAPNVTVEIRPRLRG